MTRNMPKSMTEKKEDKSEKENVIILTENQLIINNINALMSAQQNTFELLSKLADKFGIKIEDPKSNQPEPPKD